MLNVGIGNWNKKMTKKVCKIFGGIKKSPYLCIAFEKQR